MPEDLITAPCIISLSPLSLSPLSLAFRRDRRNTDAKIVQTSWNLFNKNAHVCLTHHSHWPCSPLKWLCLFMCNLKPFFEKMFLWRLNALDTSLVWKHSLNCGEVDLHATWCIEVSGVVAIFNRPLMSKTLPCYKVHGYIKDAALPTAFQTNVSEMLYTT